MNRLVALSFALGITALAPAVSLAQQSAPAAGAPAAGARHGFGIGRALRTLNLNEQQKAQIKQLMDQYRQQHPRGSTPDPQSRQQLRDRIMSVLTPQQQAQLRQELARPR